MEEIHPARPWQSSALKARIAKSCNTFLGRIVEGRGHIEFGRVVEVLGLEVVETVIAPGHTGYSDLTDGAGFDCAVGEFQHTAFQFPPIDSGLDDHLGVMPTGQGDRRARSAGSVTRLTPIDEPPRAGLTNNG